MSKKDNDSNKSVWESLVAHVSRGEEAEALLQLVYNEIGPYREGKVSNATWGKVCRFFYQSPDESE